MKVKVSSDDKMIDKVNEIVEEVFGVSFGEVVEVVYNLEVFQLGCTQKLGILILESNGIYKTICSK